MRICCYRTCASMEIQEQLWAYAEYVHAIMIEPYAEFYIREDQLAFALLLDPNMTRVAHKDLIA